MINQEEIKELVLAKMPFGKYKGWYLTDLPDAYLVWFKQKGFPKGKLGKQIQSMGELKANGAGGILRKLRNDLLNNKV